MGRLQKFNMRKKRTMKKRKRRKSDTLRISMAIKATALKHLRSSLFLRDPTSLRDKGHQLREMKMTLLIWTILILTLMNS